MSEKPVVYYFNGRGKMESIRWLLTVAEVEFDEVLLTTREQFEKLLDDGALMFQQVPLVEMDGMKLIQTKAILNYIAEKYNLHAKDPKERVMINMYSEGLTDLMEMIMILPFTPDPKIGPYKLFSENIADLAPGKELESEVCKFSPHDTFFFYLFFFLYRALVRRKCPAIGKWTCSTVAHP
uniref:glutathione transferase n=1 Tax=Neolamprologus brichardi TaxID=32507 RepID=A0A3Q4HH15_NEOBR